MQIPTGAWIYQHRGVRSLEAYHASADASTLGPAILGEGCKQETWVPHPSRVRTAYEDSPCFKFATDSIEAVIDLGGITLPRFFYLKSYAPDLLMLPICSRAKRLKTNRSAGRSSDRVVSHS